ncbi:hypothetical protein CROQUDRAFT_92848 [Cronartium quercuum f. sp. fusiforme G11]|uniref:Uncharacterized protein n=1 Tax=Cronartium quercuum f. sp. fusiforme G11 TaxID=708437 RepID=A0A9P6NHT5_9BASI|nr:hypothetical protein CROQUDRAFT_92848 [Cronartium quercuum f. sp. fusiforme G11]
MQGPVEALRSGEQRGPCKRAERSGRSHKIRAKNIYYKKLLRLLEISKLKPPLTQGAGPEIRGSGSNEQASRHALAISMVHLFASLALAFFRVRLPTRQASEPPGYLVQGDVLDQVFLGLRPLLWKAFQCLTTTY